MTIVADDTTLHGSRAELHTADERGPSGLDVFAAAVFLGGLRSVKANVNGILVAVPQACA